MSQQVVKVARLKAERRRIAGLANASLVSKRKFLRPTRKIFFETVIYGDELTKTGSGTIIYKKTVLLQ